MCLGGKGRLVGPTAWAPIFRVGDANRLKISLSLLWLCLSNKQMKSHKKKPRKNKERGWQRWLSLPLQDPVVKNYGCECMTKIELSNVLECSVRIWWSFWGSGKIAQQLSQNWDPSAGFRIRPTESSWLRSKRHDEVLCTEVLPQYIEVLTPPKLVAFKDRALKRDIKVQWCTRLRT